MGKSRREFLKQGLLGAMALGTMSMATAENVSANTAPRRTRQRLAKHILLISLDGICVEGFKKANTPNLDKLLAEGAMSLDTRVVMPSVTLPNWTSHLTGSGPEQHGVVDNSWQKDKHILPAVAVDEDGYYPSVFTVLKEKLPRVKTAFYYNWFPLAYPYNQKYIDELIFLENDGYVENYNKAVDFIVANKGVPTLSFLYTVHTDHAGHQYKWMSPEYIKSIEEADVEIGKLLERLNAEDLYKSTHIMFLSDHGGVGNGHGGVSTDEMLVPWGIVGPGIQRGMIMKEPNNTVNTAALILRLFDVEKPDCWTGEVPLSIFKIKEPNR